MLFLDRGYVERSAGSPAEPQLHVMGRVKLGLEKKMQYIGDFIHNLSHELKTPITSIKGASELLADGALSDHDVALRFVNNINRETERRVASGDGTFDNGIYPVVIPACIQLVDLTVVVERDPKDAHCWSHPRTCIDST